MALTEHWMPEKNRYNTCKKSPDPNRAGTKAKPLPSSPGMGEKPGRERKRGKNPII